MRRGPLGVFSALRDEHSSRCSGIVTRQIAAPDGPAIWLSRASPRRAPFPYCCASVEVKAPLVVFALTTLPPFDVILPPEFCSRPRKFLVTVELRIRAVEGADVAMTPCEPLLLKSRMSALRPFGSLSA